MLRRLVCGRSDDSRRPCQSGPGDDPRRPRRGGRRGSRVVAGRVPQNNCVLPGADLESVLLRILSPEPGHGRATTNGLHGGVVNRLRAPGPPAGRTSRRARRCVPFGPGRSQSAVRRDRPRRHGRRAARPRPRPGPRPGRQGAAGDAPPTSPRWSAASSRRRRSRGQLQHPGVVPVYELGRFADDRPFFTMKLVKGHTLAALLRGARRPAEDRAALPGHLRAGVPDAGLRPRQGRDPPRPEAGQRHGGRLRRSAGHGLGPGQGADRARATRSASLGRARRDA